MTLLKFLVFKVIEKRDHFSELGIYSSCYGDGNGDGEWLLKKMVKHVLNFLI